MAFSGEREETPIPPPAPAPAPAPIVINQDLPYHRQILELLRQILNKLNDIHEELANQPMIMVDENGNMVEAVDEGSDGSFDSPV
jgi:hypothetical protein